jgi:integrase
VPKSTREERIAPNIYRTPHGWRVYVRRDGVLKPIRFKRDVTLAQLQIFVDAYKQETARIQAERRALDTERAGTFAGDAARYLRLAVIQAMPSYTDRCREIARWVAVFGRRPRATITAHDIDEQLQKWHTAGDAPSSVNKYRAALMALYTRLDGRSAANPVRDTRLFQEAPARVRGLPYPLIKALLDAMPRDQSRPIKGVKGSRARGSLTRARFEVMAWTGMTPSQLKKLKPRDVNLAGRWYVSPPRRKGHQSRHARPEVRKPMTKDAHAAFTRFVELEAWGAFDTRALRHSLERARRKVEAQLRKTKRDPTFTLPHIRPYDFRHSFATELYRRTGNLSLVAEMLDHASLAMTKRYSLGAVADVLKQGMRKFEKSTTRRKAKR